MAAQQPVAISGESSTAAEPAQSRGEFDVEKILRAEFEYIAELAGGVGHRGGRRHDDDGGGLRRVELESGKAVRAGRGGQTWRGVSWLRSSAWRMPVSSCARISSG